MLTNRLRSAALTGSALIVIAGLTSLGACATTEDLGDLGGGSSFDGGSTGGTGAMTGGAGGMGTGGSMMGTGGSMMGTGGSMMGTGGSGGCMPNTPSSICGTAPQCGCPSGQACYVTDVTAGNTTCLAPGATLPYAPCTARECIAGFDCVGGVCKPYCDTAAQCPNMGSECIQVTTTDAMMNRIPVPGFKVCTAQCDLVNPNVICGPGATCVQGTASTDCVSPAGTGTGPNSCSSANPDCAPGYVCLTDNSCAKWCRRNSSTDCPTGQLCGALMTPPIINGVEYGVCN